MDPTYGIYDFDDEDDCCPQCGSDQVIIVTDDDLVTGLGIYLIYDIPQGLAAFQSVCYCYECKHSWIRNC